MASYTTFGCRGLAVKKAGESWVAIPGAQRVLYKPTVEEVYHQSGGQILGVYRHSLHGELTFQLAKIDLPALAKLLNTSVTRIDTTNKKMWFGTQGELEDSTAFYLKCYLPAKEDGASAWAILYWFKAHLRSAYESFPGGAYGETGVMNLVFDVFPHNVDEAGSAVPGSDYATGRVDFQASQPSWP